MAPTVSASAGSGSSSVLHSWPEACEDVTHVEPQIVFYYLIVAVTSGMLTYKLLHFLEHNYHCSVPYTVAVFVEGLILGLFHFELEVFKVFPASWGGWSHGPFPCSMHHSINLWVQINPHLLLVVFLPILLMGDSMGLNWTVLKGCLAQCLLLATVGVGIGAIFFAVAAKLMLPYEWGWWTCLTFGSILSATDPVAVVGLLNDLGCSKVITMQIAGESLFNDGVAMVFFQVAKAFMGHELHPELERPSLGDTIRLFIQLPLGGVIMGVGLGTLLCCTIACTSNKFAHANHVLQLASPLVIAYWGYYVGDWEFEVSGVITVIVAAFCFGRASWPLVIDQHGMHAFWHMLEFLSNTLIFFLAGTLFARSFEQGHWHGTDGSTATLEDWCYCILMYVMAIVIRALMIAILYVPLKALGMGTNPKDAAVMVWGGLRGAVGLALAMNVDLEFGRDVGAEFMFIIGGIAFFTLAINATTCGPLVKSLGMTQQTWSKVQRMHLIAEHQNAQMQHVYHILAKTVRFRVHNAEAIKSWVTALRAEKVYPTLNKAITQGLDANPFAPHSWAKGASATSTRTLPECKSGSRVIGGAVSEDGTPSNDGKAPRFFFDDDDDPQPRFGYDSDASMLSTKATLEDVEAARLFASSVRMALSAEDKQLMDESLASERELFYSVVRSGYWEMMHSGMLPENSKAVLRLLNAVDWAELHPDVPMCDFHRLVTRIQGGRWGSRWMSIKEGTFHMREMIPIRRKDIVFDLFDIITFMDAHEAALKHVMQLRTEFDPPALNAAMAQVALESKQQVATAKKFLDANNIGEDYIILARTLQLALHLLCGAKRRVHELIQMGGVSENDMHHLILAISHDSEALYKNCKKSMWVDPYQDHELVFDEVLTSGRRVSENALARGSARNSRYHSTVIRESRISSRTSFADVLKATE